MTELAVPITETYTNTSAGSIRANVEDVSGGSLVNPLILPFHQGLDQYGETPLISLPDIAAELGVRQLFLKLEATRFGLPSFKILGASWAIFKAVAEKVGLPSAKSLHEVAAEAQQRQLKLVTCTDGNWGRAVARMARYLGIPAVIYVPEDIDEATKNKIRSEASNVECQALSGGDYDDAVRRAVKESQKGEGNMLVLDTSWEGYERFPNWVKEGYSTMLLETDHQMAHMLDGTGDSQLPAKPTVVVSSVGVGSWAHAVTEYYKTTRASDRAATRVVTVEPETAASLLTSLHNGRITPIKTKSTIMNGMNCGTTSYIAWPVLKHGVDVSVAVSDLQAHQALLHLLNSEAAVDDVGPCGAAPLAALRKLANVQNENPLKLSRDDIVVLFCTEGKRDYPIPTPSAIT